MKFYKIYLLFILFFSLTNTWAQNPVLAKKYYDDGEFAKAAYEYELLLKKFPYNTSYVLYLVQTYQAQKKFKAVDSLINKLKPKKKPQLWVYQGYNFQLQQDSVNAKKYYQKAIKATKKRSYYVYAIGSAFQKLYLLDQALQVYENATKDGENMNFYLQIAQIYAEKNQIDKAFDNYLKFIETKDNMAYRTRYYLSKYITQDPENKANVILKEKLIEKIQNQPDDSKWYRLLLWLYVQQKDYKKAFFQLKSLYRKNEVSIGEIYQLANTAKVAGKNEVAVSIYQFVIDDNSKPRYVEASKLALIKIETAQMLSPERKMQLKDTFENYISDGWSRKNRIALNLQYADFTAFHLNKPDEALNILKQTMAMPLSKTEKAKVLLKKADINLYNKQFNQALVLYTQVQLDFPNNELGHKATYKIAQSSFFKGDIDWAHSQLNVIKSVASDLISNDAIDLDLIIINNKEEGDTIQAGLKTFAKAKYEIYRKKPQKALKILDSMKQNFKGQQIYDDVLWQQAQLFEQTNQYDKALQNYDEIINGKEDLLKDDALFRKAVIYETIKEDETKAMEFYKQIIIDYPASFWFVDARKNYRKLRGDAIK